VPDRKKDVRPQAYTQATRMVIVVMIEITHYTHYVHHRTVTTLTTSPFQYQLSREFIYSNHTLLSIGE